MDTIIFFLTVDGKRIKYYAKTYRENSNIVWYNPIIEKYEIFDNVNEIHLKNHLKSLKIILFKRGNMYLNLLNQRDLPR